MPWKQPQPIETWTDKQWALYGREIFDRTKFASFAFTPGTVAASTMNIYAIGPVGPDVVTTVTTGLRVGQPVKLVAPATVAGLTWDCNVAANDTLTVWIQNPTGSPLTAPPGTWAFHGMVI